jgi:hypothetical protein
MYIVISKPKRMSANSGVVQAMMVSSEMIKRPMRRPRYRVTLAVGDVHRDFETETDVGKLRGGPGHGVLQKVDLRIEAS